MLLKALKGSLGKAFMCAVLLLGISCSMFISVSADTYKDQNIVITGTDQYPANIYIGDYDVEAKHEGLDQYRLTDPEKCKEFCQQIYQEMRFWGMSANGAAAALGNIRGESGGDPSACENGIPWTDFWSKSGDHQYYFVGNKGIGLIQWTWYTIKFDLLNIAHDMDVQWMDMGCQLECLKYIAGPKYKELPCANGVGIEETEDMGKFYLKDGEAGTAWRGNVYSSELEMLAAMWCALIEKPAVQNYIERAERGREALEDWGFKDLEPKSYDGTVNPVDKNKDDGESSGDGYSIPTEWELVGMPAESGIVSDLNMVGLVNRNSLSTSEAYNMVQIKTDMDAQNYYNRWVSVRVWFAFLGLMLLSYALVLAMCLVFDVNNNFFNFSLVNTITLGKVNYSKTIEKVEDEGTYVGTRRVIISILVLAVVGCLLLSGGVVPQMIRIIYRITSKFV